MKRVTAFSIVAALLIVIVVVTVFIASYGLTDGNTQRREESFYVGVTYSGNTTSGAKVLVDKVKNYTNLFVLQSGKLQENLTATIEICDYAVDSGLNIIMYYGSYISNREIISSFLSATENRWGDHFLGLYYGDEPGGKMLDTQAEFHDQKTGDYITKKVDGTITISNTVFNWTTGKLWSIGITYQTNGKIIKSTEDGTATYYQNGSVTFTARNGSTQISDFNQLESYESLWNSRPLRTSDEVVERFLAKNSGPVEWLHSQTSSKVFTSDYGLYWFDYQCGYDVVLAQFGWNHTTALDMGLVRGAATLQNRDWGAILTWKYTKSPYLANGEELYNQMQMAYEGGARYIVLFNYAEDMSGPYGILLEEHFEALEKFWSDAVRNSTIVQAGRKAEEAFVLPANCGWGMRNSQDTVWGLWQPTQEYQLFWSRLQNLLTQGRKLDVVISDSSYPLTGKYSQIYLWNQPI